MYAERKAQQYPKSFVVSCLLVYLIICWIPLPFGSKRYCVCEDFDSRKIGSSELSLQDSCLVGHCMEQRYLELSLPVYFVEAFTLFRPSLILWELLGPEETVALGYSCIWDCAFGRSGALK